MVGGANLFFNHVYTAGAAQTTTITVSGEYQESPVTADEQVVVHVNLTDFNQLMTVTNESQASAGEGYPEVILQWFRGDALDAKWAAFLLTGATPEDFNDDFPAAKKTLQKVFATETFTYVTNAESPLLKIPPEAISNVDSSSPIDLTINSTAISKEVMVSGVANSPLGILPYSITAPASSGALADPEQNSVRQLYLQALAAGRYQQSPNAATSGNVPDSNSPGFNFQLGDTIRVFTTLTLVKTRTFIPDPANQLPNDPPGGTGMRFKIDGEDIVIGDGNTADDSVNSDDFEWTVEWILTAVS